MLSLGSNMNPARLDSVDHNRKIAVAQNLHKLGTEVIFKPFDSIHILRHPIT
jgi:hypothetical protein